MHAFICSKQCLTISICLAVEMYNFLSSVPTLGTDEITVITLGYLYNSFIGNASNLIFPRVIFRLKQNNVYMYVFQRN